MVNSILLEVNTSRGRAYLAQSVELSAVNRSVVGSSPTVGASQCGPLEKWLNSHAFHACIHGFESRIGHHYDKSGLIQMHLSR